MFRSWMDCMTRPFAFFDVVSPTGPFARPLLFFLVLWILGSGLGSVTSSAVLGGWYEARGLEMPGLAWNLFVFFLSPFFGTLGLAVNILFVHLGVRIFVSNARTIGVTARGLCYVAAPQVLAVVPLLGWFVAPFWSLFLAVVSVHRMHETSLGRAAAAVLVPALVIWFAVGMLFFLAIVLFAIAAGA
jgi:hypothetical protein